MKEYLLTEYVHIFAVPIMTLVIFVLLMPVIIIRWREK